MVKTGDEFTILNDWHRKKVFAKPHFLPGASKRTRKAASQLPLLQGHKLQDEGVALLYNLSTTSPDICLYNLSTTPPPFSLRAYLFRGLIHFSLGKRAKSESVEATVQPCSKARAAICASVTRLATAWPSLSIC